MVSCKEFECNMKYKCPQYYCVPFRYVCNGKWDCPHGKDEDLCGLTRKCSDMFKCRNSQLCLHKNDVCDSFPDCPEGDDEYLCKLLRVKCPHLCYCLNYAILCIHRSTSFFMLNRKFPYFSLHVSNSTIVSSRFIQNWKYLQKISLSNNNLQEICTTANHLVLLVSFTANNNSVFSLNKNCFSNISKLHDISLNTNKISDLKSHSLSYLPKLHDLDISYNLLNHMFSSVFHLVPNIRKLSLEGNCLTNIEVGAFKNINSLKLVKTNDYQICCIKPPEAECTASIPWHISCEYLLPDESMVITLSVVCAAILLLNLMSLGIRIHNIKLEESNAFDIIVLFVNASDLLCGTYLLVLVSSNAYYNHSFLVNEKSWRKHYLCICVFFLSFLFALASATTLMLMSVSRLMVVLYPIESQFKRKSFVTKLVTGCIFTSLILSIILTIVYKSIFGETPFTLCLSTIDPTNSNVMIKFLTFFLSTVQIGCATSICVVYSILIRTMVKKSQEANLQKSTERSNAGMFTQLVVITLSNLLCWIPTDIIFLVSLFVSNYPVHMVIWISIAVTPVNSILNPAVLLFMKLKSCITCHKTAAAGTANQN